MKTKLLFVDVETSGLDPEKHGIIQFAASLDVGSHTYIDVDYKMKPFPEDETSAETLAFHGITETTLAGYLDPRDAFRQFKAELIKYIDPYNKKDKAFLIGYNAQFDDRFLRAWFKKNGDKYYGAYFWWPPIDVAVLLSMAYAKKRRDFPNFQLGTVVSVLEEVVDTTGFHDAAFDLKITKALFYQVAELMSLDLGTGL